MDYLTRTFINEITHLPQEFLLILDDYHLIDHQDIHQLISDLLRYAPLLLHLVIATRKDPPFSLTRYRATQMMAEIRLNDLRFTSDEVQRYLTLCLGDEVPPEIVTVLVERTEGWAVGLRMACLSLRNQDGYAGFIQTFQGTQQYIMEYLVDEILGASTSDDPDVSAVYLYFGTILCAFG